MQPALCCVPNKGIKADTPLSAQNGQIEILKNSQALQSCTWMEPVLRAVAFAIEMSQSIRYTWVAMYHWLYSGITKY